VFRPRTVEYVPTSHRLQSRSVVLVQATHPGNKLYLPAPHWMHGPPAQKPRLVSGIKTENRRLLNPLFSDCVYHKHAISAVYSA